MDTLHDYIAWLGDFSIESTGFLDADALVLCALSYFDLSPVFKDGSPSHPVSDCLGMLERSEARVLITGRDMGYPELLREAASSRRFGTLRMESYTDVLRNDPPLQFSAVCFHGEKDFSFLAFRGTDNSLAGWREDFMISFTRTEAQILAQQYAEEHLAPGRRWYIGGHSKGSNLALYAANLLNEEQLNRVERVYLLDGPGFCPEVLDLSGLARLDSKLRRIIPRYCVIGKLFEPKVSSTSIVQSSASGILQHGLITWGIDHGKLALSEDSDPDSVWVNQALDNWIGTLDSNERVLLVDDLFDTLAADGAETFNQIGDGPESLQRILERLTAFNPSTRQSLGDLSRFVLRSAWNRLMDQAEAELTSLGERCR